eukprot:1158696-Pelagomonas_calceolata.AAC.6
MASFPNHPQPALLLHFQKRTLQNHTSLHIEELTAPVSVHSQLQCRSSFLTLTWLNSQRVVTGAHSRMSRKQWVLCQLQGVSSFSKMPKKQMEV